MGMQHMAAGRILKGAITDAIANALIGLLLKWNNNGYLLICCQ